MANTFPEIVEGVFLEFIRDEISASFVCGNMPFPNIGNGKLKQIALLF